MWTTHKDFISFLKEEWNKEPVFCLAMRIMMCKLKYLSSTLRVWNYTIFGDLNRKIEECSASLEAVQLDMERLGFFEDRHLRELLSLIITGLLCWVTYCLRWLRRS